MMSFHGWIVCLCLWICLCGTHCHEFHGLQDAPYKQKELQKYERRACTKCAAEYQDCENTFWEYYERVEEDGEAAYLDPWHLSQNHLVLSCITDDLMSGGDRRRKRALKGITKSTQVIPIEQLRVGNVFAGLRASSKAKGHDQKSVPAFRDRVKREESEEHKKVEVEGVIYMVRAYYGKDHMSSCSTGKKNDYCQMNAFDDKEFMIECNGAHRCWILGIPAWLEDCDEDSDYLHVEYQCIPEESLYRLDHEITQDSGPESSSGYMMSPFYPSYYKHLFLYECYLEMPDFGDAQQKFIFTVLDFHFEPRDDVGCCTYDFIDIQDIHNDQITGRHRVCGDIDPGHKYYVHSLKTRLVFHTDSSWNERGLWVNYQGLSRYGVPKVSVSCGFFQPEEDLPEVSPDLAQEEEEDHCSHYDSYDYYHYNYNDTYWYNWGAWSPRTFLPRVSPDATSPVTMPTTPAPTRAPTAQPPTTSTTTRPPTTQPPTTITKPRSPVATLRTRIPLNPKTVSSQTPTEAGGTVSTGRSGSPLSTTEANLDGNSDAQIGEEEGDSSNVAVIGGAVGAVLVVCIAVIVGIVILRRSRSASTKDNKAQNNTPPPPPKGTQFHNMNYSSHNCRGDGNEYCDLQPTAPPSSNAYMTMQQHQRQSTKMNGKVIYKNTSHQGPHTYVEEENSTYEILNDEGVYEELPGISNPAYDSEIPIHHMPSAMAPPRPSDTKHRNINQVPAAQGIYGGAATMQNSSDYYMVPTN